MVMPSWLKIANVDTDLTGTCGFFVIKPKLSLTLSKCFSSLKLTTRGM